MVIRVKACLSSQHSAIGSSIPTAVTTVPGRNATNVAYPLTDLEPIADDGTTGTVVHFHPDEHLRAAGESPADELVRLAGPWPGLAVGIDDRSAG